MVLCESMATCCIFIRAVSIARVCHDKSWSALVCTWVLPSTDEIIQKAARRWSPLLFASGTYWSAQPSFCIFVRPNEGQRGCCTLVPPSARREKQRVTKEAFQLTHATADHVLQDEGTRPDVSCPPRWMRRESAGTSDAFPKMAHDSLQWQCYLTHKFLLVFIQSWKGKGNKPTKLHPIIRLCWSLS